MIDRSKQGAPLSSQLRCHIFAFLVVGLLAGCTQNSFRAQTELLPDGRIKRSVMQTDSLADDSGWQKKWSAEFEWECDIGDAPEIDSSSHKGPGEVAYVASGTFQNTKDIPQNYRFERTANGKKFTSQLIRSSKVTDHGFVKEYVWEETLTNVVTLSDMQSALQELFQLCVPMFQKAIETSHLKEYEWSPLIDWFSSEGKDWLVEAAELYYEHSLAGTADSHALEADFYSMCSKRGLELNRKMTNKDKNAQIAKFAHALLKRLVKTKSGTSITEAHRQELLAGIGIKQPNEKARVNKWNEHFKETVEQEYPGGQEAFEERLSELSIRILGIYFFTGERRFNYSVKVPGKIVSTNGDIESENEVSWEFSASKAYPKEYSMKVRSVAITDSNLSKLLGNNALTTRREVKEYLGLVSELRKELEEGRPATLERLFLNCVKTNSLRPLKLAHGLLEKQSHRRDTASRLKRLLEIVETAN